MNEGQMNECLYCSNKNQTEGKVKVVAAGWGIY